VNGSPALLAPAVRCAHPQPILLTVQYTRPPPLLPPPADPAATRPATLQYHKPQGFSHRTSWVVGLPQCHLPSNLPPSLPAIAAT
jgi:hypothetical protein